MLKKRILQNISQTETTNNSTDESIEKREEIHSSTTTTLVLDTRNLSIPSTAHKVRILELTNSYPRLNQFIQRLKTLKTLREYNQTLIQFTDRLILFRNHIDDCLA